MAAKAHRRLRLRLWGRRVLATWLCLLRTWAERLSSRPPHPGGMAPAHLVLATRNRQLQEEFRRVFDPYHRFCPECGSRCCREPEIPFSALDHLLWVGRSGPGPVKAEPGGGNHSCRSCFQGSYLHRKLKSYTGAATAWGSYCPALGGAGCLLPWGERPAVCVFCACPQILAAMERRTYGRYIWVNLKYLTHLSLALGRIIISSQ